MLKDNPPLKTRVKIFFWGSAFHHFQDLGTTRLAVRQARCKWHGYYQDIPRGWLQYMECPICKKVRMETKHNKLMAEAKEQDGIRAHDKIEKLRVAEQDKKDLEDKDLNDETPGELTDNGSGIEKKEGSGRADNLPE